ncbi:hypothetical protein GEV33_010867 [Tenebrio molitor]|uniref:Uncharacterized protein n=1 Tax=Tenebrio molitor TaxID=7067 RepID=A0A8J6HDX5_TENMO|nr:hypothetical protein GEV33_010867 [Tenebrio molitor]
MRQSPLFLNNVAQVVVIHKNIKWQTVPHRSAIPRKTFANVRERSHTVARMKTRLLISKNMKNEEDEDNRVDGDKDRVKTSKARKLTKLCAEASTSVATGQVKMFKSKANINQNGVRELLTRVLDEPNLRVITTKLAHLRRRLSRVTVETGAQTEAKEKLSVGIEKAVESFILRGKFLTGIRNTSLLLELKIFLPVTSTPQAEAVDDPLSFRYYRNGEQEIEIWGIIFQGDRKDDLPHDVLRRHAKVLFKSEALIWLRMIRSSVSSWTDICERLKDETCPNLQPKLKTTQHLTVVLSHASLHWSPLVLVFEEQSRKGGPPAHHLPSGILHLPAGSQQTPRQRSAEESTGLLRENFFRPRPSPPPSCHKNEKQQRRSKIRTQKVVRFDNGSFPSSGRTTRSKKMKSKANLPSSSLSLLYPYVALLMGLGGACRREELSNLKLGDIENVGSALLESVNNTKTKVYRTFAIIDNDKESLDFLDMYRRYIALRPSHVQHRRLFLKYKNGYVHGGVVNETRYSSAHGGGRRNCILA